MRRYSWIIGFLVGACAGQPAVAAVSMMENVRGTNNAYYFNVTSTYAVVGSTIQYSTATLTVGSGLPTDGSGLLNIAANCIQFPSGFQCVPGISSGSVITSVNGGYGITGGGSSGALVLNLDGATSSYIQNRGTLQSGATFFVSLATVTTLNTATVVFSGDGTSQTTAYPGAAGFIQLTSTLQSGATFFVSSGTAVNFNSTTAKISTITATSAVVTASTITTLSAPAIDGVSTLRGNSGTATGWTSITSTNLTVTTATITNSVGITNASNAFVGNIGESQCATTNRASGITLASTIPTSVSTLTITAGDWMISGGIGFTGGPATTVTVIRGGISTTANTLPPDNNNVAPSNNAQLGVIQSMAVASMGEFTLAVPSFPYNSSGSTTIYTIVDLVFGGGSSLGYGYVCARRIR